MEKPKKYFVILEIFIPFPLHRKKEKKSSIKITNDKIFHVTNARKTRINWDQDYFSLEKILLQKRKRERAVCVSFSLSHSNKSLRAHPKKLHSLSLSLSHDITICMWKCCEFTFNFPSSSFIYIEFLSLTSLFSLSRKFHVELHADIKKRLKARNV